MEEKKKKTKRLAMNIPTDIHHEIRVRASLRGITITQWILRVLTRQLIEERKYD